MKPTVTNLISLLDKPALLNWSNNLGLKGIKLEEYRNTLKNNGISIHKQIELYIKEKKPFLNSIDQNYFEQYFANKKIISFEESIETDYFIGRLDVKFEYKGKIYICDFKSNHKKAYFENILQLVAYKMGSNADGIGIISVPDFTFIPIVISDFAKYEEILINLSKIYQIKKSLEYGN